MKASKLITAIILMGSVLLHCSPNNGWRTASRESAGIANSNSFTAWIAKQVPQLELELPFSALGSGYVK